LAVEAEVEVEQVTSAGKPILGKLFTVVFCFMAAIAIIGICFILYGAFWAVKDGVNKAQASAQQAEVDMEAASFKKRSALKMVVIDDCRWTRTGSSLSCRFVIENRSVFRVKDVKLRFVALAESGTVLGKSEHTVYKVFDPGTSVPFPSFDAGFVNPQMSSLIVDVVDLEMMN
jgi:hypothetical protein